jgi:hypothetical protein
MLHNKRMEIGHFTESFNYGGHFGIFDTVFVEIGLR